MQQFFSSLLFTFGPFLFLMGMTLYSCAQAPGSPPLSAFADPLYKNHGLYREKSIQSRRFKHSDLEPILKALPAPFQVKAVGKSMEGRPIYHVKTGSGPVQVLLWSQMHGDESTATMALLDLFNFMQRSDELNPLRELLQKELTLHFIPMLNPDGAERFTRRNLLEIDINRDADRLVTPEARLLKYMRDSLKADWGFNLHDQNRYYSAGLNPHTASISFLAPAYNVEKEINDVRGNAMRLIGFMNRTLQEFIPGKVARYDDTFEPRAFGDNIQKWGTSTILIESGGLEGDPEKQELRRLNFVSILTALETIANQSFAEYDFSWYEALPFNESNGFHDLILREVEIQRNGGWHKVDLAFRREEVNTNNARSFYYRSSLVDLGDMSVHHAYDDYPLAGYRVVPGKAYSSVLPNVQELSKLDIHSLLRQGITDIPVSSFELGPGLSTLPVRIVKPGNNGNAIRLGQNPSLLVQKNGETHYVVVNGSIFDLRKSPEEIKAQVGKVVRGN